MFQKTHNSPSKPKQNKNSICSVFPVTETDYLCVLYTARLSNYILIYIYKLADEQKSETRMTADEQLADGQKSQTEKTD